jgi:pyruvate,orthophosphate dikinase
MASGIQLLTPSKYELLREVVKDYPGLLSASEPLLRELYRHPKNWGFIVKEMRAYALKNFYLHDHHEKGIEAIKIIIDVFLEAINSPDINVQQAAIDSLMFYLEKILMDGDHDLNNYESIFQNCFAGLDQLKEKQFFFLTTNPHQLKKLGQIILKKMPARFDLGKFNELFFRSLLTTYEHWLKEEDPVKWFKLATDYTLSEEKHKELEELIYPISHVNFKSLILHLSGLMKITDQYLLLEELLKLPGYMQLVRFYEDIAGMLPQTGNVNKDISLKVAYLLKIMETKGLSGIHESTLREINRTLSATIKMERHDQIKIILSDTFNVLKNSLNIYPEIALYCIHGIGNEIFSMGDSNLVEWYMQKIISLGFQYPRIEGATDEWQVKSNRAHLENIRVWLELIENNPKWSKSLISALIINLSLGGIHISDTDLFQKDVTRLLNSDIKPVYHLIKQMAKLFPVYFSEIGADGVLREVSTEIDEATGRADLLVHFLRKQSHVESSARVVDFIEEVINFWRTKDKTPLKEFLPEEIYRQCKPSGLYFDELSAIFNSIFNDKEIHNVTGLLNLPEDSILALINDVPHVSEKEKKRAYGAIKFYQLLNKKYRLNAQNIRDQLRHARSLGLPNTDSLINILEKGSVYQQLEGILDYLQLLRDIILSPEKYEAVENIFRKRHIPSGKSGQYTF